MEDDKQVKLAFEFQEAFELFQKIENECINESQVIQQCKDKFKAVGSIVNSLGIYSRNETHADIHTTDLKYEYLSLIISHYKIRALIVVIGIFWSLII